MRLRLREFHAPAGEGDALAAVMRTTATGLVRDGVVDIVVVCQRADSREHALWLEPAAIGFPSPSADAAILPKGAAKHESAPLVLDFVDALYRFPLQGCRVWTLETRQPAVCRALFGLSRTMQYDRRLAGMSVYRAANDPSHALAFLALEGDHVPAELLGDDDSIHFHRRRGFACYPLVGVWTFGRLMPRSGRAPAARYPRAAFWAQLGVSVMHAPGGEAAPSRPASAARRSSRW
ncbi:MAG: hypothetical protein HYU41_23510 [Candidatus Rokubacteria bacterium]|nr:hypothetical protein [Candidatus Rokubacteria bacterium]